MKQKDPTDEELLFRGKPKAAALLKQAKKLARERDRKAWWTENKPKESNER